MILQLTWRYSDWKNYIYVKKILLLFKDAVLHSCHNFSLGSFGQACSSTSAGSVTRVTLLTVATGGKNGLPTVVQDSAALCKHLVRSLGQEGCDAQTRSCHGGVKKCRTNVDQSLMGFRDLDIAIFSWLSYD
jgi:hypothetical protein